MFSGLHHVVGRHTGENISSAFTQVLSTVDLLPYRMGYNITDNASNMIRTFRLLNEASLDVLFSDNSVDPDENILEEFLCDTGNDEEEDEEDDEVVISILFGGQRLGCLSHTMQGT